MKIYTLFFIDINVEINGDIICQTSVYDSWMSSRFGFIRDGKKQREKLEAQWGFYGGSPGLTIMKTIGFQPGKVFE